MSVSDAAAPLIVTDADDRAPLHVTLPVAASAVKVVVPALDTFKEPPLCETVVIAMGSVDVRKRHAMSRQLMSSEMVASPVTLIPAWKFAWPAVLSPLYVSTPSTVKSPLQATWIVLLVS